MSAVKIYTTKDKVWNNAAGNPVPLTYVPKSDIKIESLAGKIRKAALAVEAQLLELHVFMTAAFEEAKKAVAQQFEINYNKKKEFGKGGFTFFSFDKSVKVEASVDDIVKWDAALMSEAYECFNSYVSGKLSDDQDLIKDLITGAFKGGRGMIDTKKIFQLLKYESKTKDKRYHKACELIRQAQSVDKTKLYMRVWEKIETGEYRNINLSFTSI